MESTNHAKDESWKDQEQAKQIHVFPATTTARRTENITSSSRKEAILLDNQGEETKLQMDESKQDSKPSARESPRHDVLKDKQESEAFHMEILLGLFLRSSEEELQHLAQKAGVSNTLFKSTQNDTIKLTEETKQDSIDKPSQMPIVAHVLRDIISQDCILSSQTQLTKQQIETFFPHKYKRNNYAARTISELSSHILEKFTTFTNQNDIQLSPTTTSDNDTHRPVLETFALEYNECSMNTFANWAFQPDTPTKHENINYYYQPHAPFTFQQCHICRKYGHVEVECEELIKRHIPREYIQQALDMEQKVLDETRIQHSLRDFILEERLQKNCVELAMEQEYVSYPWIDIRTGKVSEEHYANSSFSTGLGESRQGHTSKYSAEDSQSVHDIDPCRTCGSNFSPADLLMCDGCDETFHRQCLVPPLDEVPEGDWFCNSCKTYDSEVDSITVIEGLDDFVIEQRKLSSNLDKLREREAEGGVGYKSNPFDAAMVVAPVDSVLKDRESPSVSIEDGIFLQDIRDDGDDPVFDTLSTMMLSSSRTLDIGDLCWAKRRCIRTKVAEKYGKDFFWPAIVIEVHYSSTAYDGIRQTPYIVRMLNVPGGGRLRASAILPFFEFFDELGLHRLEAFQDQQPSWWQPFSKGLREAINDAGFDSYENALAFSKQIIRDDYDANAKGNQRESTAKKLVKPMKYSVEGTRPSEWDDAEVTEIDGITILTKRSELEGPNVAAKESLSPILEVDDNVQNPSGEKTVEDEIDENQKFSLHSLNSEELKKVPIEKLVGGLVAYSVAYSKSEERILFGKCLKYNRAFRKALIQNISNFESIMDGYSEENESNLIACNVCVGSTQWIDLEDLFFLNHGPQDGNKKFCYSTLANTLQNTRGQLSTLHANVNSEDEVSLDEISLEETSLSSVELGEKAVKTGEVFDSVDIGEKEDIEEKALDSSITLEKEVPERILEACAILKKEAQIIESKTKSVTNEEAKNTGETKDNIIPKGKDTLQIAKVNMSEGSIADKAVSNTQVAQEGLGGSVEVVEKRIGSTTVSTLQTTKKGDEEHKDKRDNMSEVERNETLKALLLESRKTFIRQVYGEDVSDSTARISQEVMDNVESTKDSIIEDRIEDVAVSITEICQKEMETAEGLKDSINEDKNEDVAISTATKARKVQDNIEIIDDSTEGREGSLDNKSQEAKDITENLNDNMNENRVEDKSVSTVHIAQNEIDTVESVKDSINEDRIEDVAVSKPQVDQGGEDTVENLKESIDEGRAVSIGQVSQEAMGTAESLNDNMNENRNENRVEDKPVSTVHIAQKEIGTVESLKDNMNEGRTEKEAVPKSQIDQEAKDTVESLKESIDEGRAVSIDQRTEEGKADTSDIVEGSIDYSVGSDVQVSQEAKDATKSMTESINKDRVEDNAVSLDQVSQEAKNTTESLKESSSKSREEEEGVSNTPISEEVQDHAESSKKSISDLGEDGVSLNVLVDTEGKNTTASTKDSFSIDMMEKNSEVEVIETSTSTERKILERVGDFESSEKVSKTREQSIGHSDAIGEVSSDNFSETPVLPGTLAAIATSEGNSIESTKKQSKKPPALSTLHSIELLLNKNGSKRKKSSENQSTTKNDVKKEVEKHSLPISDQNVKNQKVDSKQKKNEDIISITSTTNLGEYRSAPKDEDMILPSRSKQSASENLAEKTDKVQDPVNKEGNSSSSQEAANAEYTLDIGSNVETADTLVSLQKTAISADIDSSLKDGTKGQADQGAIPANSRNVSISNRTPFANQRKMELNSELSKNAKSGATESISSIGAICREKENVGVTTKDVVDTEELDATAVAIQDGQEKVDVIETSREEIDETKQSNVDTNGFSNRVIEEGKSGAQNVEIDLKVSKDAPKSDSEVVEDVETIDKSISSSALEKLENIGKEKIDENMKSSDNSGKTSLDAEPKRLQQPEKGNTRPVVNVTENFVELNLQTFNQKDTDSSSPVTAVDDISNKVQKVQEIDSSMDISKSSGEDMDVSVSSGESVKEESMEELSEVIAKKKLDLKIENSNIPSSAVSNGADENDESLLASVSSPKLFGTTENEDDKGLKKGASGTNTTLENTASKETRDRLDIKARPADSTSTVSKVKNDVKSSKVVIGDKTSVPRVLVPPVVIEIKEPNESAGPTIDTIQKLNERPKKKRQIDLTGVTFKSTSPPKSRKESSTATSLPSQNDTSVSKKKVSDTATSISDKTSVPRVPVPPVVIEIKEPNESAGPTIDKIQKLNERPKKKRQIDLTGVTFKSTSPPKSRKESSTATSLPSQNDTSVSKKKVSDTVTSANPKPKKKIIEEGLTSPGTKKLSRDSTTTSSQKKRTSDTTMEMPVPKKRPIDSALGLNSANSKTDKTAAVTTPKNETDKAAANTSKPKKKTDEVTANVSDTTKKPFETEASVTSPKKKDHDTSMLTPKKRPSETKNSTPIQKKPKEFPPSKGTKSMDEIPKSLVGFVEKRDRTPTHKISSAPPAESKKPKAKAKPKAKKKNPSSAEKLKASKKRREEIIVDDVVVDPINTHERADEGIFYVERIIDDRIKNRNKEYLIKWKGYSNENNTWEKEENILDPIFLKNYLCVKYIAILTATPEGKKEGTTTRKIVNALKRGIVLMDQKPPKELSNNRVCPLCLNLKFDHKKFGGHVRKHKDEANYVHLKEIARFAEKSWFKK